jgi:hypothetical protein
MPIVACEIVIDLMRFEQRLWSRSGRARRCRGAGAAGNIGGDVDNARQTPKDIIIDAIEEDIGQDFGFDDKARLAMRRLTQADLFVLQGAFTAAKRSILAAAAREA